MSTEGRTSARGGRPAAGGGGGGGATAGIREAPELRSAAQAARARAARRSGQAPRKKESTCCGITYREIVVCVVIAIPGSILYRHWLIPTLANSDVVTNAKKKGALKIAEEGFEMIGLTKEIMDATFGWVLRKLSWVGMLPWWALLIMLIVFVLLMGLLEVWCTSGGRKPGQQAEPDPEMDKLESEVEQLFKELDEDLAAMEAEADEHERKEAEARGEKWVKKPREAVPDDDEEDDLPVDVTLEELKRRAKLQADARRRVARASAAAPPAAAAERRPPKPRSLSERASAAEVLRRAKKDA